MKNYDNCVLEIPYEDAIYLRESLNDLNLSEEFKISLKKSIEYSEEKHNLRDYLKILRFHLEADLNAFNVQTLEEFRVDGGNYAYSTGREFDAFIERENLEKAGIKIFSGFFVSRHDPDEYEWSAALVNPFINMIAVSYGRSVKYLCLSTDDLKNGWVDARRWNEFNGKA